MGNHKQPLFMLVDDSDIDLFLNKKFLNVAGITDNTISFLSSQEALDYLELAIRRGYRNYIVIKIVPELQNLHEEPRFKKLMDEVLHKK